MLTRRCLFPTVLYFLVLLVPAVVYADQWAKQPAPGDELTVPADRTEWLMKAQWYADDHQPETLLALIERTRAAYPGGEREAECLRYTAEAYLGGGKFDEAIATFQKVIALFPSGDQAPWAQYGIGEVHRKAAKYAEAVAAYQEVHTKYAGSQASGWATLREGNILSYRGDKERALAKYREVAAGWPKTQLGSRGQGYVAETLREEERWDESAVEYQRFIDEYTGIAYRSQIAKSHGFIAEMAERGGDYDTALKRYTTVVEKFGDTRVAFDARYGLLKVARTLGRVSEAVVTLQQATESGDWKDRLAAMLVLQRAHRDVRRPDLADSITKRMKDEFPASHEVDDLAHNVYYLARRYGAPPRRDYAEAIRLLEDGLQLNLGRAKRVSFKGELSYYLDLSGNHEAAIQTRRDLIADPEIAPSCKAALQYGIVLSYARMRDWAQAAKQHDALQERWADTGWAKVGLRFFNEEIALHLAR